jgi:pSer/pThr/pTyr-binding forkhead associated (FHA) protein
MSDLPSETQVGAVEPAEEDGIRRLAELAGRREELRQLLARLEAVGGAWPIAAVTRISEDYLARIAELDRSISLLEGEIPGWMANLETTGRELRQEAEGQRLDLAEQQCRQAIGEIEATELDRRSAPLLDRLAELEAQQKAVAEQQGLLLGVLDASGRTRFLACPADLAAAYDPGPGPAEPESPPPSFEAAGPSVPETIPDDPAPLTTQLEAEASDAVSLAELEAETIRFEAEIATEGTQVRSLASLVAHEPVGGRLRLVVEPYTTIGRDSTNLHTIVDPTVSRRHAVLALTPQGYLLTDQESGNGTRVNGEAISETLLKHGDRVDFGVVAFTFECLA